MSVIFSVSSWKPEGQEHSCGGEEAACDATGTGLTPLSAPSCKPPYWDSASLHSLLQGRQQWQIKLLVLFCGAGVGSTATWQKWWRGILKGAAFALSLWCHVCKASSSDEKSWNQRQCIKFCLCNHLKKKINYHCFQMHHFILLSFGFTLLLQDVMCLHMEGGLSALGLILLISHHIARHLLANCYICSKRKLTLTTFYTNAAERDV